MLPNQDNKLSSKSIIAKHMSGKHDQAAHSRRSSRSNQYEKPYYDQESRKLKTAVSQAESNVKDLQDKIKAAESDAERFESVASEATRAMKNPKFLELPINERNQYRQVRDKMTSSASSMRTKITDYNYQLDDAETMLADAKAALDNFESEWDD